ncbi:hypothetical protein TRVL_07619 [Trypanosoma vivax]|nr:hypothetical protein TRVL_07619 [Trypanosoma vivax]
MSAGKAARHGSGSYCLAPVIELNLNMIGVSSASASADVTRSNANSRPAIERLAEKIATYATQLGQDIEEVGKLERCLSTLNKMKFDLQSEVVRQRDVIEQRSAKHTCKAFGNSCSSSFLISCGRCDCYAVVDGAPLHGKLWNERLQNRNRLQHVHKSRVRAFRTRTRFASNGDVSTSMARVVSFIFGNVLV